MGSSYANVQLSTRGRRAEEVRDAVIAAIRASMRGEWIEGASGEPCERVVLIGPPAKWIAIYDDAALDTRALAAQLSVHAPAVTIAVHEGDLLQMTIYRDGAPAGDVTNWPGYFRGAAPPPRAAGDPATWRDFLEPGAGDDELLRAWEHGDEIEPATAIVQRMAGVIGWSRVLAANSVYNLPAGALAGFTELCLRRAAG